MRSFNPLPGKDQRKQNADLLSDYKRRSPISKQVKPETSVAWPGLAHMSCTSPSNVLERSRDQCVQPNSACYCQHLLFYRERVWVRCKSRFCRDSQKAHLCPWFRSAHFASLISWLTSKENLKTGWNYSFPRQPAEFCCSLFSSFFR